MADLVERHGLEEAERIARHDLARLNYPPANWVPERTGPDGKRVLDVLVVGAGMCGQTAGWNFRREGIGKEKILMVEWLLERPAVKVQDPQATARRPQEHADDGRHRRGR